MLRIQQCPSAWCLYARTWDGQQTKGKAYRVLNLTNALEKNEIGKAERVGMLGLGVVISQGVREGLV